MSGVGETGDGAAVASSPGASNDEDVASKVPTSFLCWDIKCVCGIVVLSLLLAIFVAFLVVGAIGVNIALIVSMSVCAIVISYSIVLTVDVMLGFDRAPFGRQVVKKIVKKLQGKDDEDSKELLKVLQTSPSVSALFANPRALAAFTVLYNDRDEDAQIIYGMFGARQQYNVDPQKFIEEEKRKKEERERAANEGKEDDDGPGEE
ncbi:MAG: hypothetical protein LBB38_00185 [Puniceicoccales bacterium]|jgi:hypothetical protein|nr:hypothetical protein [Puniceicoccales bacterium]